MLEKEHRVVVTDGGLHQPLGIGGRAAGDDLDAGDSMEISLKPLAVLGTELPPHPTGATHHRGNGEIAAAGVAQHPHVVGDLVEGQEQEAHVHAFNNRPQAGHRCADRHAGEAVFSDRGVQHP